MEKITLILRVNLFFYILFFVVNGVAQNKPFSLSQQIDMFENPSNLINSNQNLFLSFNVQKLTKDNLPKSLVCLFDSTYYWRIDTSTMNWNLFLKSINYIYDSAQNNISYIQQGWNDTVWSNQAKYNSTFDINNNLISQINQTWNENTWLNNSQIILTFDSNYNRTSMLRRRWLNNTWSNVTLYTFTYNFNNDIENTSNQYWNDTIWVEFDRRNNIYTYDSNNNISNLLNQHWNGTAWINSNLNIYSYDNNNNVTCILNQSWNDNNWVDILKIICTYDSSNNWTSIIYQNKLNNNWINSQQFNFTYDPNNYLKSRISKRFDSLGVNVMQSDSIFNYFHVISNVNEMTTENMNMLIYPNPVTNNVIIENSQNSVIKLLNLQGQQIRFFSTKENITNIDVSSLPRGVYILVIKSDNKINVQKFVKE